MHRNPFIFVALLHNFSINQCHFVDPPINFVYTGYRCSFQPSTWKFQLLSMHWADQCFVKFNTIIDWWIWLRTPCIDKIYKFCKYVEQTKTLYFKDSETPIMAFIYSFVSWMHRPLVLCCHAWNKLCNSKFLWYELCVCLIDAVTK